MEFNEELMIKTLHAHHFMPWPHGTSGCVCGAISSMGDFPKHAVAMYKQLLGEREEAVVKNEMVIRIELDDQTMEALRAYAKIHKNDFTPAGEWRNVLSAEQAREEALKKEYGDPVECTCASLEWTAIDCPIHGMPRG